MLRRVIARVPGVEVVGEAMDPARLLSLVNQTAAQWVIVSIWPERLKPSAVQSLLVGSSSLCVLGLTADGSQAKIICTDSTEETREGLSLDDLIAILQRRR
jgi:hypothetical protein